MARVAAGEDLISSRVVTILVISGHQRAANQPPRHGKTNRLCHKALKGPPPETYAAPSRVSAEPIDNRIWAI